jgi:hypothetical protein
MKQIKVRRMARLCLLRMMSGMNSAEIMIRIIRYLRGNGCMA